MTQTNYYIKRTTYDITDAIFRWSTNINKTITVLLSANSKNDKSFQQQ